MATRIGKMEVRSGSARGRMTPMEKPSEFLAKRLAHAKTSMGFREGFLSRSKKPCDFSLKPWCFLCGHLSGSEKRSTCPTKRSACPKNCLEFISGCHIDPKKRSSFCENRSDLIRTPMYEAKIRPDLVKRQRCVAKNKRYRCKSKTFFVSGQVSAIKSRSYCRKSRTSLICSKMYAMDYQHVTLDNTSILSVFTIDMNSVNP